jgi:CRISPR-associated endonuclease/helicase Cas3
MSLLSSGLKYLLKIGASFLLRVRELRQAVLPANLRQDNSVNKYIARLRLKDRKPQYLWNHLTEVSSLAGQFAGKIGLKEQGEILGLLHDLGKASNEFQNYIGSAVGLIHPDQDEYVDAKAMKGKVDHSSAGAQVLFRSLFNKGPEKQITAQVLSLCLASHHSGLIDCLSPDGTDIFYKRHEKIEKFTHTNEAFNNFGEREKRRLNEMLSSDFLVEQLILKLKSLIEANDHQDTLSFKYGLLIRFLLSCLIDADRLNSSDFEYPENTQIRNYSKYPSWKKLIQRLDRKISEFEKNAQKADKADRTNKNEINDTRNQISRACLDFAKKPRGIYQLKVPTGGGKTLASLRFALNHAAIHRMDRIIYVIPFTSIIDQNADEVRKILEEKDDKGQYSGNVVLEHHSNLTPDEETPRQSLLSENWDAPVVFTTQVQFLDALFGSGTKSARRMHQLANSVIIFDEVQTIPIRCVHMFNLGLRFLVHNCRSTVVLCTATQPLLDRVLPEHRALTIQPEQRIIKDEKKLFSKFKRFQVFDRRKVGGWSDKEVTDLVQQEVVEKGSVLVIVNTRSSARSLFSMIKKKNLSNVYHLSTNMCPAHRLEILSVVKQELKEEKPVICISTQLIEAGVDVDFGSVIRYLAGLDSIVQAAGRCNRNGHKKLPGNVWIVNPENENTYKLHDIRIGIEKTQRVLDEYNNDPASFDQQRLGLSALERYYQYYFFARKDEMGYKVDKNSPVGRDDDLFNLLSLNTLTVLEYQRILNSNPTNPFNQSFQTAAKSFQPIDSQARGVIVPYKKEGIEIIQELCGTNNLAIQYKLVKKAQRYSVNLLPPEFEKLEKLGAIREISTGAGIFYLDSHYYSDQFGWSRSSQMDESKNYLGDSDE